MNDLLSLPYFASSQVDVMFEIWDVSEKSDHPFHNQLKADIENINSTDLEAYTQQHNINMMLGRFLDKELARRVFYLTHLIQKEVAKEILNEISRDIERQLPYTSSNLSGFELDGHQLISTQHFNGFRGLLINGFGYELCPSIPASNSMYWAGQALAEITSKQGHLFRVRLHPFIEKPLKDYRQMMYKMTVYGRPLDWDRLSVLMDDDFGQWLNEYQNDDTQYTDYVWSAKKNDELHFSCEEVPKQEVREIRGSRYFHAIFDKQSGTIKHCDGAIRLYSQDELEYRCRYHLKDAEVRKIGHRIKLFQGDDLKMSTEDFTLLARAFFVWNNDVHQYFEQLP